MQRTYSFRRGLQPANIYNLGFSDNNTVFVSSETGSIHFFVFDASKSFYDLKNIKSTLFNSFSFVKEKIFGESEHEGNFDNYFKREDALKYVS